MKAILIKETYESQKWIEIIADHLIDFMSKEILKLYEKFNSEGLLQKHDYYKDDLKYRHSYKIIHKFDTLISDIKIRKEGMPSDILEMIKEGINLIIKNNNYGDEIGGYDYKKNIIEVSLPTFSIIDMVYYALKKKKLKYNSSEVLKIINEKIRGEFVDSQNNDVYIKEILVHEIQHMYDNFRSKGKYHSNKYNIKRKEISTKDLSGYSDKSYERIEKTYIESYLKDPVEIIGRFSQVMSKIKIFDKNGDPRSFGDILKDFKKNFRGWEIMRKTVKESLIKKLYTFWKEKISEVKNQ